MPKRRTPHAPKQARSKLLVDAVLEATARVIREVGWSKAKIACIAKVAGVSVGSLYRYFPGRNLLLSALIDHGLAQDVQAFDDALAAMRGPQVQDSIKSFIHSLVQDRRVIDPKLLRQLVDVLETADRIEIVRHTFDQICERFCERLLELHPLLDEASVHRRAHMAFWGLRGAFIARLRVEESFDFACFQHEAIWVLCTLLASDPIDILNKQPQNQDEGREISAEGHTQVPEEQNPIT